MNWLLLGSWPLVLATQYVLHPNAGSLIGGAVLIVAAGYAWPFWAGFWLAARILPRQGKRLQAATLQWQEKIVEHTAVLISQKLADVPKLWNDLADKEAAFTEQVANDIRQKLEDSNQFLTILLGDLAQEPSPVAQALQAWINPILQIVTAGNQVIHIHTTLRPAIQNAIQDLITETASNHLNSEQLQALLGASLRNTLSQHHTYVRMRRRARQIYWLWLGLCGAGWVIPIALFWFA